MAEFGKIETNLVFLALTRPAMLLGVTYAWFTVEGGLAMVYFINTSDFLGVFGGAVAMHIVGYMACAQEPRFIELFKVRAETNSKCKNKSFHGNTDSYDLY